MKRETGPIEACARRAREQAQCVGRARYPPSQRPGSEELVERVCGQTLPGSSVSYLDNERPDRLAAHGFRRLRTQPSLLSGGLDHAPPTMLNWLHVVRHSPMKQARPPIGDSYSNTINK